MTEKEILAVFEDTQALLNGHFLLTSGLHSDRYFQCAKVLQYPHLAERLCSLLAAGFKENQPEFVIAPAIGGIVVAHEVARALGVKALFAERVDGKMRLRRGFQINSGEKALVVEDVVTTGGSVREVLELAISKGARPVAIGCIVDRSGGETDFGFPMQALIQLNVAVMPPESCSLCAQNLPLVKPGSRELK